MATESHHLSIISAAACKQMFFVLSPSNLNVNSSRHGFLLLTHQSRALFCAIVRAQGFWCCPRQWTIWVISCAPVSYDFVRRLRRFRPFVWLAWAMEVRLPSFSAPVSCGSCERAESRAIVVWFSDLPAGSNDRGLTCSVNCVFDTSSQVFHRDSLST